MGASEKAAATYHPGMGPRTPITPNVSDRCLYAYHRQCGGDVWSGPPAPATACRCTCHG